MFEPPIKFYILRHGESEANQLGIFAGGTVDSPLTQLGIQDATACAELIAKLANKPDVIITSDLERTKKTADIIWGKYGEKAPELIIDPLLNERNWGDLAGKPKKDYPKRAEARKNPPNGESREAFYARSNAALITQLQKQKNRTPLVVAHKGTIEAVVNHFGLDFPDEPQNTVLYEVEITRNPTKSSELTLNLSEYSLRGHEVHKIPTRLIKMGQETRRE
jgi:broad specificity phosphatase PhoE